MIFWEFTQNKLLAKNTKLQKYGIHEIKTNKNTKLENLQKRTKTIKITNIQKLRKTTFQTFRDI